MLNVMKNVLKYTYYTVCIVLLLWLFWSWFEVQLHNWTMLSDNPYQYSFFNLFELIRG